MLCRRTIASVSLSFSLILAPCFSLNASLMYIIPFCYIFFFAPDGSQRDKGGKTLSSMAGSIRVGGFFKAKTNRMFGENCIGEH